MFNWNPFVNHVSSDEDNFNSPEGGATPDQFLSPSRPHQSPTASPRALLIPDPPPVDEILASASRQLRELPARVQRREQQVGGAAAAVPGETAPLAPLAPPAPVAWTQRDEDRADNDFLRWLDGGCGLLAKVQQQFSKFLIILFWVYPKEKEDK